MSRTIEITHATRTAGLNGLDIQEGQAIGLLDGELLSSGEKPDSVIFDLLSRVNLGDCSIMAIYYGDSTTDTDARQLGLDVQKRYPEIEIEVINGGQPHYNYIISIE